MTTFKIRERERSAILQALRAGVVPRTGLPHLQVGRTRELEELIKDIDRIGEGGAAIRFIIGEYGAGKTFFINLIRQIALEKGLVALSADVTPDRRLHATGGQARSLYAEMTKNAATRSRPEGGAIINIVERFVTEATKSAETTGQDPSDVILEKLSHLEELTGGYDFARVIARYWEAHNSGNEDVKADVLRWLRGEFTTITDARNALGIRAIVNDASVYDHLKLLSLLVREAGYKGLIICIDELVNLYKMTSSRSRESNYEQILRILNDTLQGTAQHMGVIFGGTPELLMNTRRGLYSYAALQSRLAENSFASDELADFSGPVIRLSNLTPEDMYLLLCNIRRVMHPEDEQALPDEALTSFMNHCSSRIGDAYFRTPRNTVKEFVNLLTILEQNPGAHWRNLLENVSPAEDTEPDAGQLAEEGDDDDDELSTLRI